MQADHVETVVEVFTKSAGTDQGLEVLVGRSQDPDVDRDRLRAADALERHLLEHAQQLGLNLEVDVADLVEEKRAAVGLLEPSDTIAVGPGERTLDVAEQLAFQQALRQGGTVELDERAARAGAGLMDRRGQKLLAGAALAPDQHGRMGDRDLARHADHLPNGRARAFDRLEGAEVAVARRRERQLARRSF